MANRKAVWSMCVAEPPNGPKMAWDGVFTCGTSSPVLVEGSSLGRDVVVQTVKFYHTGKRGRTGNQKKPLGQGGDGGSTVDPARSAKGRTLNSVCSSWSSLLPPLLLGSPWTYLSSDSTQREPGTPTGLAALFYTLHSSGRCLSSPLNSLPETFRENKAKEQQVPPLNS